MSALVDTSAIVRYLTDDPAGSAARSAGLIDATPDLYVPAVVLAEAAWVLSSFYRVSRQLIVDRLVDLLQKENVKPLVLDKALAVEALLLCRPSRSVSFVDAFTWAAALASGTRVVYSLDGRFPSDRIEVRALPALDTKP